jgi:hypothetical protein
VARYVRAFSRRFHDRYLHRRPLYLSSKNEAGSEKLVRVFCTFVFAFRICT